VYGVDGGRCASELPARGAHITPLNMHASQAHPLPRRPCGSATLSDDFRCQGFEYVAPSLSRGVDDVRVIGYTSLWSSNRNYGIGTLKPRDQVIMLHRILTKKLFYGIHQSMGYT
jgi:hypothetical protein